MQTPERRKAYLAANRDRIRQRARAWYQANKQRLSKRKGQRLSPAERKRWNAWRNEWRKRPEVRAREREQRKRYRATPEYRARVAAWWKSPSGVAYKRAWNSRPKTKATARAQHRRSKYGITDAQYNQMVAAQDGKCAGCLAEAGPDDLCIDHDHITGRVRGLLCSPCNKALGMAQENSETLRRLADYKDSYAAGGA